MQLQENLLNCFTKESLMMIKKAVHSFKIVFQLYIEIKFDKNRGRFIIFRKLKTPSKNYFQFKLK